MHNPTQKRAFVRVFAFPAISVENSVETFLTCKPMISKAKSGMLEVIHVSPNIHKEIP